MIDRSLTPISLSEITILRPTKYKHKKVLKFNNNYNSNGDDKQQLN